LRFPVTTVYFHGASVRNCLTNVVGHFSLLGFPNWLANSVASLLGFPNGLASGVRNFASASFPDRLADRVGPSLGFPDWLANGVANVASASFPDRLADRVGSGLGFPNWLANGIANVASASFPDRLADRVSSGFGFPNWLANGVANFLLTLLAYITSHVDDPIFTDPIVDRAATGFALAFPFYTSDGLHHGMALPLVTAGRTSIVPCCSTVTRLCYRRQQHQGEDRESLDYRLRSHHSSPSTEWENRKLGQDGLSPILRTFVLCKHPPLARCCIFRTALIYPAMRNRYHRKVTICRTCKLDFGWHNRIDCANGSECLVVRVGQIG